MDEELSGKEEKLEDESSCVNETQEEEWTPGTHLFKFVTDVERRMLTPEFASLVLLAVFAFGIASAVYVGIQPDPVPFSQDLMNGDVAGYVYIPGGEALEGAQIQLLQEDMSTATNEYGYFNIPNIPPGEYQIRISHTGYTSSVYTITVDGNKPRSYHFTMETSTTTIYEDYTDPLPPPSFSEVRIFIVALFAAGSISALCASILCFKRRHFKLTMGLAILSILSYGFLAGSILAVVAVGMIMKDKPCFDRGKYQHGLYMNEDGESVQDSGMTCGYCSEPLEKEDRYVECCCGNIYHVECALDRDCPICGQSFQRYDTTPVCE